MTPRLALLVTLLPALALADEYEASVHLEGGPAAMRLEGPLDDGVTAGVVGARVGARATYGLTHTWAAEATLGALIGKGAEFEDQELPSEGRGTAIKDPRAVRFTAGVTARLGVRFIPTLTAHIGIQQTFLSGGYSLAGGGAVAALSDRSSTDLLAVVGAGLDYRVNARWIAGVSAQLVHAVSLSGNSYDAFEVPIHLSYYWYPRW